MTVSGNSIKSSTGSPISLSGDDVTVAGDLTVAGSAQATEFNSTSDEKHKQNIVSLENPLEKVLQLEGRNYQWKKIPDKTKAGLIAQEVEGIIPELVLTNNDEKSLDYNGLIPYLVECIKSQQKQIDELKLIIKENIQ